MTLDNLTHNARVIVAIEKWRDAVEDAPPIKIPVSAIIDAVCEVYKVEKFELLGPRRNARLVSPRYHAINMAIDLRPDMSLTQLGRIFHRDHTVIMHARKAWANLYNKGKGAHIAAVNAILFKEMEPMIG